MAPEGDFVLWLGSFLSGIWEMYVAWLTLGPHHLSTLVSTEALISPVVHQNVPCCFLPQHHLMASMRHFYVHWILSPQSVWCSSLTCWEHRNLGIYSGTFCLNSPRSYFYIPEGTWKLLKAIISQGPKSVLSDTQLDVLLPWSQAQLVGWYIPPVLS